MIRKVLCAVILMGASIGMISAETIKGRITKIDDKSLTVVTGKKGERMEKTLDLAGSVRVSKQAKKGTKESVAEGLKAAVFQNIGKKGVRAIVVTDDNNRVTEVVLVEGGKKNGKKKQ